MALWRYVARAEGVCDNEMLPTVTGRRNQMRIPRRMLVASSSEGQFFGIEGTGAGARFCSEADPQRLKPLKGLRWFGTPEGVP